MNATYISIVGFEQYFGMEPFKIGALLTCRKDPDNEYDDEAIAVFRSGTGKVGFIANSVHTKANGTSSAGRIYDSVGDKFTVTVRFTTRNCVIAEITDK